jgi:N-acylneuraminate cytidylyltransferase
MYYLSSDGTMEPVTGRFETTRRQDLPMCYVVNGAVYAGRVDAFERVGTFLTPRTLGFVMPEERSIDIDEEADFEAAEAQLGPRLARG